MDERDYKALNESLNIWKYEEYSQWSRQLARTSTKKELEKELKKCEGLAPKYAASHILANKKSTSMQGNSQNRAHTGNVSRANQEKIMAIKNALELHEYYPEKCLIKNNP